MESVSSALCPVLGVSGALAVHVMHAAPCPPAQASIQESLTFYICQRLQTARWQHVHFELSGATVQVGLLFAFHALSRVLGEGALKGACRAHQEARQEAGQRKHTCRVVGTSGVVLLLHAVRAWLQCCLRQDIPAGKC